MCKLNRPIPLVKRLAGFCQAHYIVFSLRWVRDNFDTIFSGIKLPLGTGWAPSSYWTRQSEFVTREHWSKQSCFNGEIPDLLVKVTSSPDGKLFS